MGKMASAFNTSVSELEDELSHLILNGQIQARIDSHNKVYTPQTQKSFQRYGCFINVTYCKSHFHDRKEHLIPGNYNTVNAPTTPGGLLNFGSSGRAAY